MQDEERAKRRVEDLKQAIADSLNKIEWRLNSFKFECEQMGWNSMVAVQIQDACRELGFALATLVNWYKEEGETK
jgi:hypothetical protein